MTEKIQSAQQLMEQMQTAKPAIEHAMGKELPHTAIILGTGLGGFVRRLEQKGEIRYEDIPKFPSSTVTGHAGTLVNGRFCGKPLLVLNGRFHYYEGYSMSQLAFPIRVLKILGVETLIVSNAVGGIRGDLVPGDLVLLQDHIKLCADSPLRGANLDDFGPRFPDMGDAYTKDLRQKVLEAANAAELSLKEGVYGYMTGPSFETPAEIRMLAALGADVVGMSTIPEVITAVHCGMHVLGISTVTNKAAGLSDGKLVHDEILQSGEKIEKNFIALLEAVIGVVTT